MMNIGDVVKYEGDFGATKVGKIGAIGSDKDSYNDVTLKDGVFLTYSKKLKKSYLSILMSMYQHIHYGVVVLQLYVERKIYSIRTI